MRGENLISSPLSLICLLHSPQWDGWKKIYFVGTEWSSYPEIFENNWNFDALEKEITDGDLKGKKVYLFGTTEGFFFFFYIYTFEGCAIR